MNGNNRLPDFLIVGAMKSGTSTLADYLASHKSIHLPANELHYFNRDERFSQGVSWYSSHLMKDYRPGEDDDSVLVGEKTPTYSYQPNCAERIRDTIPNVKLIWIFRNPTKRSFSHFLHAKQKGADLLDFRAAIAREPERIKKNIFAGYVERSKYVIQVERFLKYFSIDQMHFMLFENLLQSPETELNRVAKFLGVSRFCDDLPRCHSNPSMMPFSPLSLQLAKRLSGYDSKLYRMVNLVNYVLRRKKPQIPKDVTQQLDLLFDPYNQRLSEITGLDLEIWQASSSKIRK